jgi:anti-sigma factor RsiW
MICRNSKSVLPDLLLNSDAPSNAAVRAHVDSCAECREELASLQATFALLDEWKAPEPSPYFDQKLAVLVREEQAKAPAGWFERMRSRLLFNTGRQFRPAFAGALALVLLIGGGTLANFSGHTGSHETSATVTDLQVFDKNDQALQTMDQLLQDDGSSDDTPAAQPTT